MLVHNTGSDLSAPSSTTNDKTRLNGHGHLTIILHLVPATRLRSPVCAHRYSNTATQLYDGHNHGRQHCFDGGNDRQHVIVDWLANNVELRSIQSPPSFTLRTKTPSPSQQQASHQPRTWRVSLHRTISGLLPQQALHQLRNEHARHACWHKRTPGTAQRPA
jgi:hypothetical protein